jgi:hypothetical protein
MNSIRLRGPADILAALPYQLGYHPSDAVVVVALRARSIGLVQRLDLPPAEHIEAAVAALIPGLEREQPDAVLLVGYEPTSGAALGLLDALDDACCELGINVLDRLVVRDGRWFAPDCQSGCCPAEGSRLPAPEDTPAIADFVALEMSPLQDRASLARTLAADPAACREVERALTAPARSDGVHARGVHAQGVRAQGVHAERDDAERDDAERDDAEEDHADGFAQTVRRLRWLTTWAVVCDVSAARPPLEGLAPEEAAALAHSLRDIPLRDGIIAWLCPGTLPLDTLDEDLADLLRSSLPEPAWGHTPPGEASVVAGRRLQSRLGYLCRVMPDTEAAPMLTVYANLAWWLGDGAMARTALDRALAAEPGYRLARLLDRMLDLAIRPRASA